MHIIFIIALARDVIFIDFTINCARLLCLGLRSVSYILICFFFFLDCTALGVFAYNRPAVIQCHFSFLYRIHEDISGALHNLKEVFNFRQCL